MTSVLAHFGDKLSVNKIYPRINGFLAANMKNLQLAVFVPLYAQSARSEQRKMISNRLSACGTKLLMGFCDLLDVCTKSC